MAKRKIRIPASQMRAAFKPETFNEKDGSMELVFSTGARGKRHSFWDGPYHEELSMEKKHVRLDRLKKGAPLYDNHNSHKGLRSIIGVVEDAWIDDGVGVARVRFSTRPEVQDLIGDVKAGIIRNTSVGYEVHEFKELDEETDDGAPVYRAVDWEPYEISLVGMPFDMHSQVRSREMEDGHEVLIETKGEEMGKKVTPKKDEKNKKRDAEGGQEPALEGVTETPAAAEAEGGEEPAAEGEKPAEEKPAEAAPAAEGEKPAEEQPAEAAPAAQETREANDGAQRAQEIQRQKEVRSHVRLAGLPEEFADTILENPKLDLTGARDAIFKELEKRTDKPTKNQHIEVRDMEMKQLRREAAVRGLLHRADPINNKLEKGDNEFRQGSIIDTARHFLHLEGVRDAFSMSRTELAKRALHSSSDFPLVLEDMTNKSLRKGYEGAPSTYQLFTAVRNVKDFKQISSVMLGNGGQLEEVKENGEYRRTTLEESGEKYAIKKFGIIVGRTWELMVNDDLDAFTKIPARMGVRARELENKTFWNMIIANAAMADGVTLFHADHGNLGTNGAISETTVNELQLAMQMQTDLEGELSPVTPKYLVVPAARRVAAQKFLASVLAAQSSNVNVFANAFTPVVEPLLDAASASNWYLFADKSQIDMAEMALLDGKGPEMFVREGFDVDGMELKIRYVFGMGILDHRGFAKNPNA